MKPVAEQAFVAEPVAKQAGPLFQTQGVANVAEVAKQAGAEQVVLVSSMLVTPKNRWNPIRLLLNNIRWGLMDEKFNGEWP
eukprot:1147689-Pelagomonas_calceolata.AAC.10